MGIRSARTAGLAVVLAVTGCAQLAGIDETSRPPDAPASDTNRLTMERISIGSEIVRGPQDLTGQTATYLVASDPMATMLTPVGATIEAPNNFVADVDAPAIVEFTLPDQPMPTTPILRGFDFPQQQLTGAFVQLEHPNPTPAPTDAQLSFSLTSDVPFTGAEQYQLYIVGAWMRRGLGQPALVGEVAIVQDPLAYTMLTNLTGRPHEAITVADSVLVLRHNGNQLQGVLEVAPFDQTGADTIAGTLAMVATDQNLDFTWDAAVAQARYTLVRPQPAGFAASWALRACPGASVANDTGPLLHARGIDPMMEPTLVTATYGNPFAARWPTLLTVVTSARRTHVVQPAALPIELVSASVQQVAPALGTVIGFPAELPMQVSIDSTLLSTDGIEVRMPTKPAIVTFTTPTPQLMYGFTLYEIVPTADGMALTYSYVFSRTASSPKFPIPADRFVVGKQYMIRVLTYVGGYTGVGGGDLRPNTTDMAYAYHDAGIFTVVP